MSEENSNSNNTSDSERKMIIFDVDIEAVPVTVEGGPQPTNVLRNAVRWFKAKPSEVTVDQVKKNMKNFLNDVEGILEEGSRFSGKYAIDTVEINAEISANGQVGFMGTGVGLAGKTGLKFVFKRANEIV